MMTTESGLKTVDTLMAGIPWAKGNNRMTLLFHRTHGWREYLRLRTFNKHNTKGVWYPSPRFFVIPMDCAEALGRAILDGVEGVQGTIPAWYEEFEREYEARSLQNRGDANSPK